MTSQDLWTWPEAQAARKALYEDEGLQDYLILNEQHQVDTFGMSCESCDRQISSDTIRVALRPHLGTSEEVLMVGRCSCGHLSYMRSRFTYNGPSIASQVLDRNLRAVTSGRLTEPPLAFRLRTWLSRLLRGQG